MKIEISFLANWQTNEIEQCEVFFETNHYWDVRRARPQPTSRIFKGSSPYVYQNVLPTFEEALAWIRKCRLRSINGMLDRVQHSIAKLETRPRFYSMKKVKLQVQVVEE